MSSTPAAIRKAACVVSAMLRAGQRPTEIRQWARTIINAPVARADRRAVAIAVLEVVGDV
ncbi:MAG: hypothetical protein H6875_10630 [Hyphomicrobiaceae bacterium]|nr:hypothetical protein [Hyphomicrobiaceae bacterium]